MFAPETPLIDAMFHMNCSFWEITFVLCQGWKTIYFSCSFKNRFQESQHDDSGESFFLNNLKTDQILIKITYTYI